MIEVVVAAEGVPAWRKVEPISPSVIGERASESAVLVALCQHRSVGKHLLRSPGDDLTLNASLFVGAGLELVRVLHLDGFRHDRHGDIFDLVPLGIGDPIAFAGLVVLDDDFVDVVRFFFGVFALVLRIFPVEVSLVVARGGRRLLDIVRIVVPSHFIGDPVIAHVRGFRPTLGLAGLRNRLQRHADTHHH